MLHAKYVSDRNKNDSSMICIVADDTDICILLWSIAYFCRSLLYFFQISSISSIKIGNIYHNVSAAAGELGEAICEVLPSFYAFTRFDFKTFSLSLRNTKHQKIVIPVINNKIICYLSTIKANIAQLTDFVTYVVYDRAEREKSPGKGRYAILFVIWEKKEKVFGPKTFSARGTVTTYENTNFVSYGWTIWLSHHFEILNPSAYGWNVSIEKLEENLIEGLALPTIAKNWSRIE